MSRRQAANELWRVQAAYEVRPLALSTVYGRIWQDGCGNWHLIGRAHDYTV